LHDNNEALENLIETFQYLIVVGLFDGTIKLYEYKPINNKIKLVENMG